jgi:glycosyltransferase involved in cell wall biosynthesis
MAPTLSNPAGVVRPRVLLLLHEATRTGAPIFAERIFRRLAGDIDLRTVAWVGGPLEADLRSLGRFSTVARWPRAMPVPSRPRDREIAAKMIGRVLMPLVGARIRAWRPDVVYANSVMSLPLVKGLGLTRYPILLHVQELTTLLEEFDATHPGLLQTLPTRYVAVTQVVADSLDRRFGIKGAGVIPPFVDRAPRAERSSNEQRPLVVGGIGLPTWIKGIDLWLLAARDVVRRLPPGTVTFRWVGVGNDELGRQMRARVERLGLHTQVQLVPPTVTPEHEIEGFDVLAVTSWEESASLVTLEAMAASVPVVAFRGSGGPSELLGNAGVTIDLFSPTDLADALVTLLSDHEHRLAIGRAGRERLESSYPADRAISRVREELDNTIRIAGGTPA